MFSSLMDSFESMSTITFIQVDYDPAVIPSSWTVFSAGKFLVLIFFSHSAVHFLMQEHLMRDILTFHF
jgi:hypothetical protein